MAERAFSLDPYPKGLTSIDRYVIVHSLLPYGCTHLKICVLSVAFLGALEQSSNINTEAGTGRQHRCKCATMVVYGFVYFLLFPFPRGKSFILVSLR